MLTNSPISESQNAVLMFGWAGLAVIVALFVYYTLPYFNKLKIGSKTRKLWVGLAAICAFIYAAAQAYEPAWSLLFGSLHIGHLDNILYGQAYLLIGIGAGRLYRNKAGEKLMWAGLLALIPIELIVLNLSLTGGIMIFLISLALTAIPIGALGLLAVKQPR